MVKTKQFDLILGSDQCCSFKCHCCLFFKYFFKILNSYFLHIFQVSKQIKVTTKLLRAVRLESKSLTIGVLKWKSFSALSDLTRCLLGDCFVGLMCYLALTIYIVFSNILAWISKLPILCDSNFNCGQKNVLLMDYGLVEKGGFFPNLKSI